MKTRTPSAGPERGCLSRSLPQLHTGPGYLGRPKAVRVPSGGLGPASAFTLIEILVTMTLLTVIVFGLLMMFNQTQRAFRAGMGQTDVLEGGRGAIDMLVRELEQMTPCEAADGFYLNKRVVFYNFFAAPDPNWPNPTVQYLVPGVLRTNIMQQFFVLSRFNQDWTVALYRVVPDSPGSAVGSLYRYSCMWPRYEPLGAGWDILNGRSLNGGMASFGLWATNRVADGIVHLRLRAFDTNGVALVPYDLRDLAAAGVFPLRASVTNAFAAVRFSGGVPLDVIDSYFWNNSLPASLELEMGILEPKTLQHYRANDPTTAAAQNYFSNHVGQVYLFRQRIPIRNVDFSAYQ